MSRKTKAVLSKRNNIPAEILLDGSKIKINNKNNRKRKSSSTDGSNLENKKSSWDTLDCDQATLNGSEWGSDEDDMLSDTDIQNLDQCLADIFIDPQFSSFFSDSSSPLSTSNLSEAGGNQSLSTITTEKQNDDLFIMTKQPSELSVYSNVFNNNYNHQHQLSPFISAFSKVPSTNTSLQTPKHLQSEITTNTDILDRRHPYHQHQHQQQKPLPNLFDMSTPTTVNTKTSMMIEDHSDNFGRRLQPFHESEQYSRDWNKQKSRESEAFLQELFPTHSIHKPSASLIRSIPDLSLIETTVPIATRDENSFGFFTDFLLDESMHSNSIENYFDL